MDNTSYNLGMRTWNLGLDDPLCLTLAADSRLIDLDYANDQIWELQLGRGTPAAILLNTTYGLRARHMRIFPRFTEVHKVLSDPAQFNEPPKVHRFYPNYLELSFSPFNGIQVQMQHWVPDSHTITGRIDVSNHGASERKLTVDLASLLTPLEEGQTMELAKMEAVWVLRGQTADLYPVVFITGGAGQVHSPYTALRHEITLAPGSHRRFTWALATLDDWQESFRQARGTAARSWEAELARIEMTNTCHVEIFTGDKDWDAVFALGQTTAYRLLHSGTEKLPNTSFVHTRNSDQGYSYNGDGSDYNHLWNGQDALSAWYLSQLLLPGGEEVVRGLLRNFIRASAGGKWIDARPGLAGQRAHKPAMPLLASLAWRLYRYDEDRELLQSLYPRLLDNLREWLSLAHDRDQDGYPEWDNPLQTGFEDNPSFAFWHSWALGSDISMTESPDLGAYLYRECDLLLRMAKLLGREENKTELQNNASNLHRGVQASWDAAESTYRYRDHLSHSSQTGELLVKREGPGELVVQRNFYTPTRLMVRLETDQEMILNACVIVKGTLISGEEREMQLGRQHIQWLPGLGSATLPELYTEIDRVVVEGLPEDGRAALYCVDHKRQDHTLLTPLWAGIPDEGQVRAVLERKIENPLHHGKAHGIPACLQPPAANEAQALSGVWLPWNVMVGEGLLAYGERQAATRLVSRIMAGITANLKREHAFRKQYHAEVDTGMGEANALQGLPPVGLFLATLGVRIISPWKVYLDGFNPYPHPVRLQYRGLTIECRSDVTGVVFPDGQSVTIDDPAPCVVDARTRSAN